MTRRKAAREAQVLDIIFRQGGIVPCAYCRKALTRENLHRDHGHALKLGGPDEADNWFYIHNDPCHKGKTNGKPHTSLGSDKHAIAKVKRLRGETRQGRKKKKIENQGFDTSRKQSIPSRPFPKRKVVEAVQQ